MRKIMIFYRKNHFLLFLLFLVACDNPFATREPEPPSEDKSNWLQPTTPERVLENLKISLQEGNSPNYMKCLTDSSSRFHFIPDPFVKANNPVVFDSWSLNSEQNYITKLFSATKDSIRSVIFNMIQPPDYQDSVFVQIDYELEIHHSLTESFPKTASGRAEYWLNNSQGLWYITRWVDRGTGDQPNWSSLKASFGK